MPPQLSSTGSTPRRVRSTVARRRRHCSTRPWCSGRVCWRLRRLATRRGRAGACTASTRFFRAANTAVVERRYSGCSRRSRAERHDQVEGRRVNSSIPVIVIGTRTAPCVARTPPSPIAGTDRDFVQRDLRLEFGVCVARWNVGASAVRQTSTSRSRGRCFERRRRGDSARRSRNRPCRACSSRGRPSRCAGRALQNTHS